MGELGGFAAQFTHFSGISPAPFGLRMRSIRQGWGGGKAALIF
jgi:hypothetical protein